MKISEIFRQAAWFIEQDEADYCCTAIDDVCYALVEYDTEKTALKYFDALFKPMRNPIFWWDVIDRDSRVVALCLAAAIAESEGK